MKASTHYHHSSDHSVIFSQVAGQIANYSFSFKALETHFLRQYLDILSFVLGLLDKSANLQHVFIAIATNLRSVCFQVYSLWLHF